MVAIGAALALLGWIGLRGASVQEKKREPQMNTDEHR
jgi:hypothetical protein